jgi:hypothetical protein
MIVTNTEKVRIRDHLGGGWSTKYEGRRTVVGTFSVHAVRSGPVFDTVADALKWATTVRTQGELTDSSQELIAAQVVQPEERKPKRRAKK